MKNLSLKLWSVAIACALALFVHGQSNRSIMSLIVPIELKNLPSDRVVLLPRSPQAQVTLRGPSYILSDITKSPLTFSVSVPEEVGNRYLTPLQSSMLASLSPSVEVMSIEPAEIEFVLDSLVERQIKVEVPRIGSLKPDYRLGPLTVTPPTVRVMGPATELDSLKSVETQQIDLRSFTTSTEKELQLRPKGLFMKVDPDKVTVRVEVKTVNRERKFQNVPVRLLHSAEGRTFQATPKSVNIEISGPKLSVQKLTKKDIIASVIVPEKVIAGPKDSQASAPVKIQVPKGIEIVYVNPERIKITGSNAN